MFNHPDWLNLAASECLSRLSAALEQLRQLGDVGGDLARLIACQQLGYRTPAGVILEIDVRERLAFPIPHDDAAVEFFDGPWWWKIVGHANLTPSPPWLEHYTEGCSVLCLTSHSGSAREPNYARSTLALNRRDWLSSAGKVAEAGDVSKWPT